jgi:hypothetical protein
MPDTRLSTSQVNSISGPKKSFKDQGELKGVLADLGYTEAQVHLFSASPPRACRWLSLALTLLLTPLLPFFSAASSLSFTGLQVLDLSQIEEEEEAVQCLYKVSMSMCGGAIVHLEVFGAGFGDAALLGLAFVCFCFWISAVFLLGSVCFAKDFLSRLSLFVRSSLPSCFPHPARRRLGRRPLPGEMPQIAELQQEVLEEATRMYEHTIIGHLIPLPPAVESLSKAEALNLPAMSKKVARALIGSHGITEAVRCMCEELVVWI